MQCGTQRLMTCEELQTIWCPEASVEGLRQERRLRVV